MALSDGTIRAMIAEGKLIETPIEDAQIQPASVDVRLGSDFKLFGSQYLGRRREITGFALDPFDLPADLMTTVTPPPGEPFLLNPGEFALATIVEFVRIPDDIICRIEGKSSLARLGLAVHVTAGFVDAGFAGTIVLELANLAPFQIKLWPGMKIAQLSFDQLDAPAVRPYGSPGLSSKYQNQVGTQSSRYSENAAQGIRPEPAPVD